MIYTKENKYDLFIQMMDTLSSLGLSDRKIAEKIDIYPQYIYSVRNKQRPVNDKIINSLNTLLGTFNKSFDLPLQKPISIPRIIQNNGKMVIKKQANID